MKKALVFIGIILFIVACQKSVVPLPVLTPPNTDTIPDGTDTLPPPVDTTVGITCTPFLQRTVVQRDAYHADSAFLQLPCNYNAENNTEQYPLLVFLNGMYEGSDYGTLNKLLKLGPPKFMADSMRFTFTIAGKQQHMIVICPQSERGFRRPHTTNEIIDYMVANYRIDTKRIYLTGLSAGANSVFTYLTHKQQYASRIAGAVPMSSTFVDSAHRANFHFINQANVHMLVYCGVRDSTYLKANKRYVDTINVVTPGLAEFETYNGAHGSWNHLYNPTQRDNRVNMYEWLLQFSK